MQFCHIISTLDHMQLGIVRIIINSIIVKRHQHSLIDCIRKRQLIWHIIIADLIDVPAVHSLRCRRQTKQKFRLEIIHNLAICLIDHMMTFINHNIIKIIRCKILLIQIFRLAERLHRSKNHRLINTFIRAPEKTIILGTTDITKRSRCLIQNLLAMRNKQNSCICF